MATVVNCPACQRPLRVTEELIGTSVRCPSCREVFTGAAPTNGSAAELPTETLNVTTSPTGSPIAPVTPPPADPDKIPCPSCQTPNSRMLAVCHICGYNLEAAADAADDDDRPWESRRNPQNVRRDCEPHRGTLILVLGIISLVFTGLIGLPFGIGAWILGQRDLRKIQRGEMDPAGEATTKAGQVCGIVGTVLGSICTVASGAYMVIWIAVMLLMPFSGAGPAPVPPQPPPPTKAMPIKPAPIPPAPMPPLEGQAP